MKSLISAFSNGNDPQSRYRARFQAADYVRVRGSARLPQPPRDIFIQSAPRGVYITWKLPSGTNTDIVGWRVYKGDESTLYQDIRDRGTRQAFVEATSGTTPPVTNVFVSSMSALGKESNKVQAQGTATAETGAPTMPTTPPGYTAESSGGGDRSAAYGGRRTQYLSL